MTRSLAELRQYLAGEWLFDNDFKDTSGNDNHGTPTDIEWKPTLRGMKPKTKLKTSYITFNDPSLSNQFSLSLWIKLNDSDTDTRVVEYGQWGKGGFSIQYTKSAQTLKLYTASDSGWFGSNVSSTNIELNQWVHFIYVFDTTLLKVDIYKNGSHVNQYSLNGWYPPEVLLSIGKITNSAIVHADYLLLHNTKLSTAEALNLYNETKGEYGVMPAEHNYTHNPDDVIDPSDAVGAWGTAKEDTTELTDLSGNSHIAAIEGPMPAEGFIQSRRFGAIRDYLDCGNIGNVKTVSMLVKPATTTEYFNDLNGTANIDALSATIRANNFTSPTIYKDGVESSVLVANKWNHIIVSTASALAASAFNIGKISSNYLDGWITFLIADDDEWSTTEKTTNFNTFARLPFWAVNYTDYPDNVTEYTDNLPYSSSIVNSGTFKVDDDKLQCVSAGTMTYSASYEFDGSEFVKVTIDDVEYAGTGTITQGNTTVSVAQGSNKITIVMGTGDAIEGEIGIQFREEV